MKTTASEIMSSELITAQDGITIEEALKLMMNSRITGLPVVDRQGHMVGVLSEYDILAQVAGANSFKPEIFHGPCKYSKSADSIRETAMLPEIISRFVDSKYRRLPVVDGKGKLLGIITRRDLMRVFYYRSKLQ